MSEDRFAITGQEIEEAGEANASPDQAFETKHRDSGCSSAPRSLHDLKEGIVAD